MAKNPDPKENWVIPFTRLPKDPLRMALFALVIYMFLERFNLPGWAWGILGTIYTVLQLQVVIIFFQQKRKDILFVEEPIEDGSPFHKLWQRSKMQ